MIDFKQGGRLPLAVTASEKMAPIVRVGLPPDPAKAVVRIAAETSADEHHDYDATISAAAGLLDGARADSSEPASDPKPVRKRGAKDSKP